MYYVSNKLVEDLINQVPLLNSNNLIKRENAHRILSCHIRKLKRKHEKEKQSIGTGKHSRAGEQV
jgi:hypothetical protein